MYDLTLVVSDGPQGFDCEFEYDAGLFDGETIARMAAHFQTLLAAVVADADQRISQVPLLGEQEREQVTAEWNRTRVDFGRPGCVHQLFEAEAQRTADALALVFEGQTMSYRQLDARANQLAHFLVGHGVGPEVPVGICLEPSLDLAVAILATLKAGGFYVPLDPEDPRERLDFFAADSRPAVILSLSSLADRCPVGAAKVVHLDAAREAVARESESAPPCRAAPDNAVCLLYTSGSTGKPKGAVNLHRGIANYLLAKQQMVGLGPADRILFTTPIGFDTSVEEFFFPLTCGGCLVIERAGGQRRDMSHLVQLIAREQVTTACFVPSTLRLLLEEEQVESCRSLKRILVGGEALTIDLVQRFFQRLNAELYNEYGPTEASINVAVWNCRLDYQRGIIPIGRPIANVRLYILDAERQPVPIGVPGELYIGGVAVARGYLNRPELNAERFLPDPFSGVAGETMYRTGDRCRWLPDGNIQFLGRRDSQVKIHGGRLELGEVEAAVSRHPAVAQAAVVVRQSSPDYKYLAAYVVPRGRGADNAEARAELVKDMRQFLKTSLPEYMIPQAFEVTRRAAEAVQRQGEPRRPAGDRALGPAGPPLRCSADRRGEAIGGHLGRGAASGSRRRLRQLLRPRRPFAAGRALASRIRSAVFPRHAADHALLRAHAGRAGRTGRGVAGVGKLLPVAGHSTGARDAPLPTSYGQEALWVISQLGEGLSPYVTFPAARVRALGPARFGTGRKRGAAAPRIVAHHLHGSGGPPGASDRALCARPLPVVDLSGLPAGEREQEVRRYGEARSQRPMDLSKGPLASVEVLRLSAGRARGADRHAPHHLRRLVDGGAGGRAAGGVPRLCGGTSLAAARVNDPIRRFRGLAAPAVAGRSARRAAPLLAQAVGMPPRAGIAHR